RSNTAELSEGARVTAAAPEATAPSSLATFDAVFSEAFRFGGMLPLDHNTLAIDHKIDVTDYIVGGVWQRTKCCKQCCK
ncbi:MAG: hypothetical protein ACKPJ9_07780, partial [Dolichospermum sp.]